jgi:hypothetical protein
MKEIKAFVGHSFSKNDETVVDRYLKYFDQLTRLLPNFSWDHAEAAEPIELAEKVLAKITGKNVFIGLCTRNELAISNSMLLAMIFQPSHWKGAKRDFAWKTSDWILQEIGLAIGRGLDIVLLLEEGVRRPGGFKGTSNTSSSAETNPNLVLGRLSRCSLLSRLA